MSRTNELCEHYACRCARAAELAELADRTGNGRYLLDAIEVHYLRVRCRMVERFEARFPRIDSESR